MKRKKYIPEQGDVVYLDFDPAKGHEQKGRRPGLVVSQFKYNKIFGLFMVVPITTQQKGYPFEVLLESPKKIQGVVLSDHLKSFDISQRNVKYIEKADSQVLKNVLEKINLIIS